MRLGRRFLIALAAVAVALALQTTLGNFGLRGAAPLDLVTIVVVYLALLSGPVQGIVVGSAAGLAQDALSSGIIGIGGLAKTLVGFFAGVAGRQFILTAPLSRFVVFVLASAFHAAVFMGLYAVLELRQFEAPWRVVASQALGNGFVGVVLAQTIEWLPGVRERTRARRTMRP